MKLSFTPGYYEWHIKQDDNIMYVLGSNDNENYNNKEELNSYLDMLINVIDEDYKEHEIKCYGFTEDYMFDLWKKMTKEDKQELKKIMFNTWNYYYL